MTKWKSKQGSISLSYVCGRSFGRWYPMKISWQSNCVFILNIFEKLSSDMKWILLFPVQIRCSRSSEKHVFKCHCHYFFLLIILIYWYICDSYLLHTKHLVPSLHKKLLRMSTFPFHIINKTGINSSSFARENGLGAICWVITFHWSGSWFVDSDNTHFPFCLTANNCLNAVELILFCTVWNWYHCLKCSTIGLFCVCQVVFCAMLLVLQRTISWNDSDCPRRKESIRKYFGSSEV